jgi:hypothetical protein
MSMKLRRRVIVYDSSGLILKDSGLGDCHSFVVGFLGAISGLLAGGRDVLDIYGATQRTVPNDRYESTVNDLLSIGGEGDELMGIVVGSGDSAESTSDYKLAARIGAGTLYPSNHHFVELEDEVTASQVIIRAFSNLSTQVVTIRETGIQVYNLAVHWWREIIGYQDYSPYLPITELRYEPYDWYGLIVRDILDTPYLVPSGGAASVQYCLEIPKP